MPFLPGPIHDAFEDYSGNPMPRTNPISTVTVSALFNALVNNKAKISIWSHEYVSMASLTTDYNNNNNKKQLGLSIAPNGALCFDPQRKKLPKA